MKDGAFLKESLQDFSANQYFLTVDNPDKVQMILKGKEIPFIVNEKEELGFLETEVSLQTFID